MDVQVPGQKETLPAILTLPPSYLTPDKVPDVILINKLVHPLSYLSCGTLHCLRLELQVKEVGIVLGHGSNAGDWKGKFLTELAAALASEGDWIESF